MAPAHQSHGRIPLTQGNTNANRRVLNLIGRATATARREAHLDTVQELKNHKLASDLTKQISRRWKAGDVYTPHDLTPAEMKKWKMRGRPEVDVFDVLDIDPLQEYKVCLLCFFWSRVLRATVLMGILEFLDNVRIHDAYGQDKAFCRNWA